MRIPPTTDDDGDDCHRVVVLDERGEWVDEEGGVRDRFESNVLGRVAVDAPSGVQLECETALVDSGRDFGWRKSSRRAGELRAWKSLAALAILEGGELKERPSIAHVDRLLSVAGELVRRRPWDDPDLVNEPRILATIHDGADGKDRGMAFTLRISPPTDACGAFWVSFARSDGDPITFSIAEHAFMPASLDRYLRSRGLGSGAPTVYVETGRDGVPRAPTSEEWAIVLALLDLVANAAGSREVAGIDLRDGDLTIRASLLRTPSTDGRRVGRNDPCPCGSGKKYKRCHLEIDRLAQMLPDAEVRPAAGGRFELILPTDGHPVPEGGYDDCPICQAKTDEERLALMRKHSGERVH